jgi:hypothetical protein
LKIRTLSKLGRWTYTIQKSLPSQLSPPLGRWTYTIQKSLPSQLSPPLESNFGLFKIQTNFGQIGHSSSFFLLSLPS